ncbi:virion structural protein [Vibrio phage USC-1]|uniref:Big-1 domain-containing protein n=2 Tax=Aphroditevirus USC1 TaxID=2846605 RepID=A0A514A2S5_9CAUD|nr:virion structural protein [Vibrio phage USC-1]QCW23174.1 hypothetical protein [Vibrio phage 5 TSL-2019]QDH47555.1 hypothetical protein [Vibrio phage USC-1]
MFEKDLKSPSQSSVIPGAGPQLPNENDRGRLHYIWDIYDPDTVKPGEAHRYVVPREKEMVLDPEAQQMYMVTHVNWESDLKSTLQPIFNTGDGGNDVDGIFGLPSGFQGEAIVAIDYSVRPNRAVIDGQVMAPGAAYALLYEGNTVGDKGKVISVVYSNNNQLVSDRVPVTLAAYHELSNKEIMITQPFSVNRNPDELPDGSRTTLVWYDAKGNVIPKARTLTVQHTSMLRDHQVGKRYIKHVELLAPWFLNTSDPKTLNVPVNTMLQNLAFRAMVHYSDGSRSDELAIDGQKVQLLGLNEHKPSTPSQRGTLTLVYNLDADEHIYEAQPGNPNQYRSSYWLLAVPFDGAYSPKLYSYPTWVNGQYILKHFLTDLDRKFMIDATDHVRINEMSPAFRPTTYGVEQTLELNCRLSDVVPTFKPMIMRQSTTFVLKAPGTEDGSKFDVRYSYDRSSYSDPTFKAINQADGRQEITFGGEYDDLEDFLDQVYRAVEPGFNPQREKGPIEPTHFEILATSGKTYEYEISRYAEKMWLDVQEPQGRTIYVRWIHESIQGDRLILATTGISIDVTEGPDTETPVPTTIEFDTSVPNSIGELQMIEFSGRVYDQKGALVTDGLTKMLVKGGVQHDTTPRKVDIGLDGTFRFFTWSERVSGATETFEFDFEVAGELPDYFLSKDIRITSNPEQQVGEFFPYTPTKVSINKAGRAYGQLLNSEGQPLRDTEFFSYMDDDLDSIRRETTDETGKFLLTRIRKEGQDRTTFKLVVMGNRHEHLIRWVETEPYGDRITLDVEDMSFVGNEPLSVKGLVYDQYGDLVDGVKVNIGYGPLWQPYAEANTAGAGKYELTGSPKEPGDVYQVVVWTDNSFAFGNVEWTEAPKIAHDIVMSPDNVPEAPAGTSVRIAGQLVDEEGNNFTSDSRTPVYMKELKDADETIIYAGFDGRFEAEVGPYGDWEETTFTFRLENGNQGSHSIRWMGEPPRLAKITFDDGLPVTGKVGESVTLSGKTFDQHDEAYLPGIPFEFEVEFAGTIEKAQSDGNGNWTYKAVGIKSGSTTYGFSANNRAVGSYTINFTGDITVTALPSDDRLFRVPYGMNRVIGWYVLDEDGKGKPGVELNVRQTSTIYSPERQLGTIVTDEHGIATYEAPYLEDEKHGVFFASLGLKEAQVVVKWSDETGISVTMTQMSVPAITYGRELLFTGVMLDENGDPLIPDNVSTGIILGGYDRSTFEHIPVSIREQDSVTGEFTAYMINDTFVTKDIVLYNEVNNELHTVEWAVPDITGAYIEWDVDQLPTAVIAGEELPVTGKIYQSNGALYTPRIPEKLSVRTDEGPQADANIMPDGTIRMTLTSESRGVYTYSLYRELGDVIDDSIEIEWVENASVTVAPYSFDEVPQGESGEVWLIYKQDGNQPIQYRNVLVAVGSPGPGNVPRTLTTDEFGIVKVTLPYNDAKSSDTVTGILGETVPLAIHNLTWVEDTVKVGTSFRDLSIPTKVEIGAEVEAVGEVLDKSGALTDYNGVGIYDKTTHTFHENAVNSDGSFSVKLGPLDEGDHHLVVYTGAEISEHVVRWDSSFVNFDSVGIDESSNRVALITK